MINGGTGLIFLSCFLYKIFHMFVVVHKDKRTKKTEWGTKNISHPKLHLYLSDILSPLYNKRPSKHDAEK